MAQRSGGYAGAMLRAPLFAQEVALGGLHVPFAPDASSLFSNSSALAWLEEASVSGAWSSPSFGIVSSGAISAALPIGRFAAAGIGIATTSSGEQKGYDAGRQPTGIFTDQELALVVGGSLAIGPGSAGATVRLLRRGISGTELSNSGYAVDIGGTLEFGDRLYLGASVANLAGEMIAGGESTLRERIPWETRVNATYVHPFEERTETMRVDPTGTSVTRRVRPRSYALAAAGVRLAQIDSLPTLGVAAEIVPLASVALGFRAGANTAGDISGGFLYRLPVEFTSELRIDYGVRWSSQIGDVTHHVSMTVGL